MRFSLSALGLAVLASPLAAAWFEVSPPAPTSQTPIAVTFTTEPLGDCGPTQGQVTIAGNAAHVRLFRAPETPSCPPDVRPRTVRIELGTLPIGEYALTAEYNKIEWSGRFVVRNPNPVLYLPVSSKLGGIPVTLPSPIGEASVAFGGVAASSVSQEGGFLVATTPPHDAGLYTIKITGQNGQQSEIPGGIYYFDPALPPDLTMFEPILFPVLDSPSGAFGTRWTATATIQNNGYAIETFNRVDRVACFTRPCMELRPTRSTFDFPGMGYPHGALLWVPRQAPSSIAVGLRIVDMSNPDDIGFELMPLRESQFFRHAMTLLNVPLGAAYRTKLRIYALDPLPEPYVSVGGIISSDPLRAWGAIVPLQRSGNLTEPAYAEVDLQNIEELQGLERMTIQLGASPGAPVWAFVSAVHNKSQRTLIITPQ